MSTWLSREAKHFQGTELAPRSGVVVESYVNDPNLAMVVADLVNHQYVFVKTSCFKNTQITQTKSQHQKDERAYFAKENVQFTCNSKNIVNEKVARFNKRIEINMEGSHFLVDTRNVFHVMSGNQIYCYTDGFGLVASLRHHACANLIMDVTCRSRIAFDYKNGRFFDGSYRDKIHFIKYRLSDATSTDPDGLDFAEDAPWNRDKRRSMYTEEYEFQDAAVDRKRKYINQLGYYLGNGIVLIPSLPRLKIRLAWVHYVGVLRTSVQRIEHTFAFNVDVRSHPYKDFYVAVDPAQTIHQNLNATISFEGDQMVMIADLYPILCCPGFFFAVGEQFIVHDLYGVFVSMYRSTKVIRKVRVRFQDGDPFSYTPLYIEASGCFNVDLCMNYLLSVICYHIEGKVAHCYSMVMPFAAIRMRVEDADDGAFVGEVYEVEIIDTIVERGQLILYVLKLRDVSSYKVDVDRSSGKITFYMEVTVLRDPLIIAFNAFCGAVGMGEITNSKVPGLNHCFPAIVAFRPLPCEFQLRPYILRMARQGDERLYEFAKLRAAKANTRVRSRTQLTFE